MSVMACNDPPRVPQGRFQRWTRDGDARAVELMQRASALRETTLEP